MKHRRKHEEKNVSGDVSNTHGLKECYLNVHTT